MGRRPGISSLAAAATMALLVVGSSACGGAAPSSPAGSARSATSSSPAASSSSPAPSSPAASSSPATSSSSAKPALTKINVVEGGAIPSRMAFYVALYGHMFQKYGLSVNFLEGSSGSQTAQLLAGGKVQFALGQVVDGLNAKNAGVPVSGVAMLSDKYVNALLVGKKFQNKVKDLPDLANEPIGITAVGSGTWQLANFAAQLGHVPKSERNFVSIGGAALTSGADLLAGRVAAQPSSDPTAVKLIGSGEGTLLLDALDLSHGVSRKYPAFVHLAQEPFIFTWIYGTKSYVNSHKKVTQDLVDALQAAENYTFSHSATQVAQLLLNNKEFKPFGIKYMAESVTRIRDTGHALPRSLAIPKANYTDVVAYASQVKSGYSSDKYSSVVDNSFANAAVAKLGTGSTAG